MRLSSFLLLVILLFSFPAAILAQDSPSSAVTPSAQNAPTQTQTEPAADTLTFRTTVRRVIVDVVVQYGEPPSLLRIRNRILQQQRRSVRPRRILKRKHGVISHHIHQRQSLFKFPFRLARKSNNQIASERYIAPSRLNPADALQVLVASVEPLHGIQHARRSALDGQMHMIAKRRHGIDDVNDVPPKIARMRSGKPHPPNSHH